MSRVRQLRRTPTPMMASSRLKRKLEDLTSSSNPLESFCQVRLINSPVRCRLEADPLRLSLHLMSSGWHAPALARQQEGQERVRARVAAAGTLGSMNASL